MVKKPQKQKNKKIGINKLQMVNPYLHIYAWVFGRFIIIDPDQTEKRVLLFIRYCRWYCFSVSHFLILYLSLSLFLILLCCNFWLVRSLNFLDSLHFSISMVDGVYVWILLLLLLLLPLLVVVVCWCRCYYFCGLSIFEYMNACSFRLLLCIILSNLAYRRIIIHSNIFHIS